MVVALIISFSQIINPAFSEVKASTPCTKLGLTSVLGGKKFTCIKSGKKLIWNNGVNIPVKSPLPLATPSKVGEVPSTQVPSRKKYSAWQIPVSKSEISISAKENFKLWLGSQSTGAENIEISINPEIQTNYVDYLSTVMKLSSRTLLQNEKQVTHMYISTGDAWAISKVKKDYPDLSSWSGSNVCYPPNPFAACAWPNFGIVFFIAQTNNDWERPNPGVLQSGAHEYFHLVQDVLMRNNLGINPSSIANGIPSWFYEGSATFIGIAFADESGLANWAELRDSEIGAYANGRGTNEPLESFQVNALDRPQPEGQSHRPYGIGFLACELIVASVGVEPLLQIFKQLGLGKTFEASFHISVGIPLEEFYAKFESMRTQVGFYPLK